MKRTVCGLDVHKDSVFCCILCADGRKIQHKFGVLTEELITLRDLMESEGVEECAMEKRLGKRKSWCGCRVGCNESRDAATRR